MAEYRKPTKEERGQPPVGRSAHPDWDYWPAFQDDPWTGMSTADMLGLAPFAMLPGKLGKAGKALAGELTGGATDVKDLAKGLSNVGDLLKKEPWKMPKVVNREPAAPKPKDLLGDDAAADFYRKMRKGTGPREVVVSDHRPYDPVKVERDGLFKTESGGYGSYGKGEAASTNPVRATFKADPGGHRGLNEGRRRQIRREWKGEPTDRHSIQAELDREANYKGWPQPDLVMGDTQRRLRQTPIGKKMSQRRHDEKRPEKPRRVSVSSKQRTKDAEEGKQRVSGAERREAIAEKLEERDFDWEK